MTPPSKRVSVLVQVVPVSAVEKMELLAGYMGVPAYVAAVPATSDSLRSVSVVDIAWMAVSRGIVPSPIAIHDVPASEDRYMPSSVPMYRVPSSGRIVLMPGLVNPVLHGVHCPPDLRQRHTPASMVPQ
jgi:hypothetical protein